MDGVLTLYRGVCIYTVYIHSHNIPLWQTPKGVKMTSTESLDILSSIASHTGVASPAGGDSAAAAAVTETPVATTTPVVTPAPAPPRKVKSTSVAALKVTTKFTTGKQSNIAIRTKHDNMQVVIPKRLSHTQGRLCLAFPKVQPYGVSTELGLFLQRSLGEVVRRWKTLKQAKTWVKNKREAWREQVKKKWEPATRQHRRARKRKAQEMSAADILMSTKITKGTETLDEVKGKRKAQRRLPLGPSPAVYKAKKKTTLSIPVPMFEELLKGHVIGLSLTLRVYPKFNKNNSSKPVGILLVPAKLAPKGKDGNRRRKEYSLVVTFGADAKWLKFVAEYIGYAVGKWTTLTQARKWCREYRATFVSMLEDMWEEERGGDRFWTLGPSRVPADWKYIKAGWFNDKDGFGTGLFCAKKGMWPIFFSGPASVTELRKHPVSHTQGKYIADVPESDEVYCPTTLALKVGAVNHAFIVQHNRKSPTHDPGWDTRVQRPCLMPKRVTEVGEEFCFDYGYEIGKDITSEPDSVSEDEESMEKTEVTVKSLGTKLDV